MDERNDAENIDEVMLPGFRFHPTDEELVGFYLKRKVQQKPLSVELIRQLDIYKFDPWDLPRLAATGEKEWYFYCQRDRKYRNSSRPNRVTQGGFWKATGTDRPIYSSEMANCIGLKKSLVFYKGRAAKGIKTDWMMHELRLPSFTDPSLLSSPLSKTIPANELWAICKIFRKTNSMAQRALSQSRLSPIPKAIDADMFSTSPSGPCIIETGTLVQFGCYTDKHPLLATSSEFTIANEFNASNCEWGAMNFSDGWKSRLILDSTPCASEMSTIYSVDECYT